MDKRWQIFCSVVDNYGDIGVCWRLARQLHADYGLDVTLWVDDLTAFMRLHPGVLPVARQAVDGVQIVRWDANAEAASGEDADVGDVIIEAFACDLPQNVVAALRRRQPAPLWLNLEYLSAEDWVLSCHGLPSPQGGGLNKYFFFPGFAMGTGGVLAEAGLKAAREGWQAQDRLAWRQRQGVVDAAALTVSLFAYENAALPALLDQWRASPTPLNVLVPEGRVVTSLAAALALDPSALVAGQTVPLGAATLYIVPMRPQAEYDAMLWSCDINFVRGEDSFVRAQWAALPLIWQIYPQNEDAHLAKLDAFLDLYLAGAPAVAAQALREFWLGWNSNELVANAWQNLLAQRAALAQHALLWAAHLDALGNLAANLVRFANARLK